MDHSLASAFGIKAGKMIISHKPPITTCCFPIHMVWHKPAFHAGNIVRSASKHKRIQSVSCRSHAPALAPAPALAAVEAAASFEPSVWGEFFIHHEPQPLQASVKAI